MQEFLKTERVEQIRQMISHLSVQTAEVEQKAKELQKELEKCSNGLDKQIESFLKGEYEC